MRDIQKILSELGRALRANKAELERELALAIARRDKKVEELIELRVDLRDVERQIAAMDAKEALDQQRTITEK